MTAQEIIKTVEFVVDGSGKPKAAIVDMQLWKTFVTWLESLEDGELARERLVGWREKKGWRRWEDFDAELNSNDLSLVGESRG